MRCKTYHHQLTDTEWLGRMKAGGRSHLGDSRPRAARALIRQPLPVGRYEALVNAVKMWKYEFKRALAANFANKLPTCQGESYRYSPCDANLVFLTTSFL